MAEWIDRSRDAPTEVEHVEDDLIAQHCERRAVAPRAAEERARDRAERRRERDVDGRGRRPELEARAWKAETVHVASGSNVWHPRPRVIGRSRKDSASRQDPTPRQPTRNRPGIDGASRQGLDSEPLQRVTGRSAETASSCACARVARRSRSGRRTRAARATRPTTRRCACRRAWARGARAPGARAPERERWRGT